MQASINLIKEFETPVYVATYCNIRDSYYIGYGQTLNVYNGLIWTKEQVEFDLQKQVSLIHKFLLSKFIGMLEDRHMVAMISLLHDIGTETFLKSDMPKFIQAKNYLLVGNTFKQFNKHGRTVSVAKVQRRLKEHSIFTGALQ